ncbi:MAG: hypothetical protein ACKVY0_29555, partial [Prosthecobacter sp.]|uniref:hypothetical protein n=1 Tax=Prosthecobacter sp. TaxID=1965333 RepID=UPI003901D98D
PKNRGDERAFAPPRQILTGENDLPQCCAALQAGESGDLKILRCLHPSQASPRSPECWWKRFFLPLTANSSSMSPARRKKRQERVDS